MLVHAHLAAGRTVRTEPRVAVHVTDLPDPAYTLRGTRPSADAHLHVHLVLTKSCAGSPSLHVADLYAVTTGSVKVVSAATTSQLALVELDIPPPEADCTAHEHALLAMMTYLLALEDVAATPEDDGPPAEGVMCVYAAAHWAGADSMEDLMQESDDSPDPGWVEGPGRLMN